jgi:hypothetical protein
MNFQKLLSTCDCKLAADFWAILDRLLYQSLFTGFVIALPSA